MAQRPEVLPVPNLAPTSPVDDRRRRVRALIPEAFDPAGHLDSRTLLRLLGESKDQGTDSLGGLSLTWPGKSMALDELRKPSVGALRPNTEASVSFETAKHVLVEGDNLEVLKLLQSAYYGCFKVIYLDPPYNLGADFIYPHDEPEGLETYLKFVGAPGEPALDIPRNSATEKSYHSRWLRMMLPRLVLVRNLLRDDGALFVSVDDHEAHHLRSLLDEVFGEENFLCSMAWEKRYSPPPDTKDIGYVHETILFYRKSEDFKAGLLPLTAEQAGRYKSPDGDPRGPWKAMDYTCRYSSAERPNLYYPIRHPKTGEDVWPKKTRVWAYSKEETQKNIKEKRLWWGANGTATVPALKNFRSDIRQGAMPSSLLDHETVGNTDESTKELRDLLPEVKFTPKPTRLIQHLLQIGNVQKGDLVGDFFAGTGTTGHAVVAWNKEHGDKQLSAIMVQLPERLEDGKFRTMFDLAVARVTKALKKFESDEGLRVLELGRSNFRAWDPSAEGLDPDQLRLRIEQAKSSLLPKRSESEVVFEILCRAGLPLDARFVRKKVCGVTAHVAEGHSVAIFMKEPPQTGEVSELEAAGILRVICLDSLFASSSAKANLWLRLRDHGIALETV